MINDKFLIGCASLLSGSSYTIPSHAAFGSTTGVLSATDVVTSGEFSRTALDSVSSTVNVVKYMSTLSSALANNAFINIVGLHNNGTLYSSGNLQANFLVASLLHTTAFDVNVEFWISFERNE